jgi:L-ornithine N5-oxygenase
METPHYHDNDKCPFRESVLDTVGIGFGPSNIALAVAHEESGNASSLAFFEASPGPAWQPGMRIDGADIQHNPLRDFVTPRNPCSPYGYLSYLKAHDRLFHFLNLDSLFPPRSDYEEYVRWVASAFAEKVFYAEPVVAVLLSDDSDPTGRRLVRVDTPVRSVRARSLSFAPGRSRHIPRVFESHLGDHVLHFADYAVWRGDWERRDAPASIAVIGASQSAVEILLDLRSHFPGTTLHSVFRSFSFVRKDTSPFTEDLLFPSFTDYFYEASPASKQRLTRQVVRSNYGSVDHDVLARLYFVLYDNEVRGDASLVVHNNTEVVDAALEEDGVRLCLDDVHTGRAEQLRVGAVILATGFRNTGTSENEEPFHPLLADVVDHYERGVNGALQVTRSYQLVPRNHDRRLPPIFLNGLCESSHGLGDAGSFSLLSYRSHEIERALAACLAASSPSNMAIGADR